MLVNPTAGRGRGAEVGRAAAEHLRGLGAEVLVSTGGSPDEMRRLASEAAARRPDAIVVVGGDGTLSLILDEVLEAGPPIALIPAGTGNDLARSLGLPRSPIEAAELAITGASRTVDVGEAECGGGRKRFLTIAALGFDARVAERTNRLRHPRGPLRYYLAIAIELLRLRPFDLSVALDGAEPVPMPGILIAVGNTRSYGGGIPMCPEADPGDGLFDITHAGPIGRMRLLRLLPLLLKARHRERKEVTLLHAARVEIAGDGIAAYADGELVGEGRIAFRVLRNRLRILVPAPLADRVGEA